ncbi:hypothetical protein Tco_0403938 [Tanacetum coccineum]
MAQILSTYRRYDVVGAHGSEGVCIVFIVGESLLIGGQTVVVSVIGETEYVEVERETSVTGGKFCSIQMLVVGWNCNVGVVLGEIMSVVFGCGVEFLVVVIGLLMYLYVGSSVGGGFVVGDWLLGLIVNLEGDGGVREITSKTICEGENSAKRQKTFEHGTYVFGESSSGQVDKSEPGNSRPEKIVLSLHKFPAVIFPDDDIEERTSRWVDKCMKKFNPYARYNVKHWKNPHAKIFYIKRQKEPGKPKEEIY